MHSNFTIENVSWPHFSWATLYRHSYSDIIVYWKVITACLMSRFAAVYMASLAH